jgi:ubiquinone/menaquinone biosynthesis C-methylase UbiE
MNTGRCIESEDIGRAYDEWLSAKTPTGLYMRWYLTQRKPREYLHLLRALGEPRGRLLDVGCAGGLPLVFAYRRGWGHDGIAGIDASQALVEEAARRLSWLPDASELVTLQQGCAEVLPFADAAFDAITCNGLVKYLDDAHLSEALAEMHRVCTPGGRVGIAEFGPHAAPGLQRLWRVKAIEDQRLRPSQALAEALTSAGFSAVEIVRMPRIRRFPYEYVGVVATKAG